MVFGSLTVQQSVPVYNIIETIRISFLINKEQKENVCVDR